ncbi:hypothetical protein Cgig2_023999 [Carnegiea gigantea]|uniref:RRM domain-containing protein n=1 Tax=Carnegiea gigantea TaxID=171969 RepID=A0A9Q1QFT5_9CARY|nr:hypothetical protein Cgig2_023999 [Carnegiea gigantea]
MAALPAAFDCLFRLLRHLSPPDSCQCFLFLPYSSGIREGDGSWFTAQFWTLISSWPTGRHCLKDATGLGKGWKNRGAVGKQVEAFQLKPSPRSENRGNQDRTFSIFIDNLPVDLDNLGLKTLFSGYGVVMDAYVPDKVGRMSGRKYGFVRFDFKKRPAQRLSDQRKAAQKKMICKWILKKNSGTMPNVASKDMEDTDIQVAFKLKNDLIYDASSPYKQALLCCPNDNNLEAWRSANEAVEEDVHKGLSDNSKTITQPLNNAPSRPIYVGKSIFQVPRCGSSMEDGEEIDSTLCLPFV